MAHAAFAIPIINAFELTLKHVIKGRTKKVGIKVKMRI